MCLKHPGLLFAGERSFEFQGAPRKLMLEAAMGDKHTAVAASGRSSEPVMISNDDWLVITVTIVIVMITIMIDDYDCILLLLYLSDNSDVWWFMMIAIFITINISNIMIFLLLMVMMIVIPARRRRSLFMADVHPSSEHLRRPALACPLGKSTSTEV